MPVSRRPWSVLTTSLAVTAVCCVVKADVDPKVQDIQDKITEVLTKLDSPGGISGQGLTTAARYVEDKAKSFIAASAVVIEKEGTGKLLVALAENYIHNTIALADLFGDWLTLDATKLDSAFILWNELSKLLPVAPDMKATVTVLTAIKQTAEAIEAVVADATQQFHLEGLPPPTRRDTTVSGHVEHGSGGTSVGVRVSHSWRRRRRR
ncbi:hypothetical protein ElyMa_003020700 [Elysia marginata]|uniref:Uncharacterized protein n=1 Tax=Elysia marginata TaxID=1093978 RepID=A0AAV4IFD8_9GAST|nr:hypothetical protein ElyMa_003020700 [Elysia marginata]